MSGSESARAAAVPTVDYHMELIPLAAATMTLTAAAAAGAHGSSAGESIKFASAENRVVSYFISDSADGGPATGVAVSHGDTLKSTGAITANVPGGELGYAIALSDITSQGDLLNAIKTGVGHANGHNNQITVGNLSGNTMLFTQATSGGQGNGPVTENLANISKVDFTGGADQAISPKLSFDLEVDDVVTIVSR